MYIEDLIISYEQLMNNELSIGMQRFYAITFLQSIYFCLEILFQSENTQNTKWFEINKRGHNLNKLYNKADFEIKNDLILNAFYLVNFWARSTFEQLNIWNKFDVPELLNDIKTIYQASDPADPSLKNTIEKIKKYFPQIQPLLEQFPSIEKIKNKKITIIRSDSTFELNQTFPLQKFRKLRQRCIGLLNKLPLRFHAKFSQVIAHLKLIEGIFEKFNQKKVSSTHFSLLVRQLIFWENSVLEGILQVLHGLKTGRDTRSHDLSKIYQRPHELTFLTNIHNIARYPFTVQKVKEGAELTLHDCILRGELLREHPELGLEDSFQMNQEKTELNYIPISAKKFTAMDITKKLSEATDRIYDMIIDKILPEITTNLS